MLKKIILKTSGLFILFFIIVSITNAKTVFHDKNWYSIGLYGGYESASSFFDINENRVLQLYDSLAPITQSVKDYNLDFTRYYFGVKFDYAITSDILAFIDVPLSMYSLKETYLTDDSNRRFTKSTNSLTKFEYFGFGTKYKLFSGKSYTTLNLELRVPSGFHKGIYNDPKYPFLSDGAFELFGGFTAGIDMNKSWLETSLSYNYRAEELKDQLLIHLEGGISTIPETKLYGVLDYVQSTDAFKDAFFNPVKTIAQENYLSLGFGFSIFFNKNVFAEFQYSARILGKNSWILSNFYLTTGYAVH